MIEPWRTVVTVTALLVMLLGLLGTVLPVLPGAILIFLAALGYAILDGFRTVGWPTLAILGVLTLVASATDLWVGSVGAKMGGASGWSVAAGLLGGLVGFVVFSLPGSILGAVAGVLISELIRLKDWRQALKAGGGWALGWLLSVVLRVGVCVVMIAVFVWQLVQGPP